MTPWSCLITCKSLSIVAQVQFVTSLGYIYIHFRLRTRQVKHPVLERLERAMRAASHDHSATPEQRLSRTFWRDGANTRQDEARLSSSVSSAACPNRYRRFPEVYRFPTWTAHLLRWEALSAVFNDALYLHACCVSALPNGGILCAGRFSWQL